MESRVSVGVNPKHDKSFVHVFILDILSVAVRITSVGSQCPSMLLDISVALCNSSHVFDPGDFRIIF